MTFDAKTGRYWTQHRKKQSNKKAKGSVAIKENIMCTPAKIAKVKIFTEGARCLHQVQLNMDVQLVLAMFRDCEQKLIGRFELT